MANIQNGFNTWYIASIQTLSSQYWNKSFFNVESKNKNRKFRSSCVSLHTKISISIKDSWKLDGYMGILSVTHSNKNTFWKVVPYLPVKNILFDILWTLVGPWWLVMFPNPLAIGSDFPSQGHPVYSCWFPYWQFVNRWTSTFWIIPLFSLFAAKSSSPPCVVQIGKSFCFCHIHQFSPRSPEDNTSQEI